MRLLDTNFILRFLLKDHPIQSEAARTIIKTKTAALFVPDIVIAEVIWVLTSFYKLSREETDEKIYHFLGLNSIYSNKDILIRALYFYRNFNISFIDSYLASFCEEKKLDGIYSFDKGLDKIKEVKRFNP